MLWQLWFFGGQLGTEVKKGRKNLMKVKVIQDTTVEPSIVSAGA